MYRAIQLTNPRMHVGRFMRAARDFAHLPEPKCVRCLSNEQTPDSFWCERCREG